jgi:hypothetical protein
MSDSQSGKIFRHKIFQHKIFKITIVALAVLMGGLLVSGVVGYFTLMEKIEAGTLEEVAERLPADAQTLVVFRGLGELGRDFLDALQVAPEDERKRQEIEDEYGIDLSSPWDLYETGIDPFRPFAVAALHLDMQMVDAEEGETSTGLKEIHWDMNRSVTAIMIPVHDEEDAYLFVKGLIPRLDLGTGPETSIDLARETAQGVSFGETSAMGVENGYLFFIYSGDPSFEAVVELKRVMEVEPATSLYNAAEFSQQRALVGEEWNFVSWGAPGLREPALTRYFRDLLNQEQYAMLASSLSHKVDLESIELGGFHTVAHLSPELGRIRSVVDLSPMLGGDSVQIGPKEQAAAVGNPGIFPMVSGTPLAALRLSLNTEYLWTEWLSQNEMIQENLEMLPPGAEEIFIDNLSGNITLAVLARGNPVQWEPGDSPDEIPGLIQGSEAIPFPIKLAFGIEFKDSSLLLPELEGWGMPCEEPEVEDGIWWCSSDASSAIGVADNHLIYAFGVDPRSEFDAVRAGKVDSIYATLVEPQGNVLTQGPDFQGLVWVENLAAQVDQTYLNLDIIRWFQLAKQVKSIEGMADPVLELLATPPSPEEVGPALDEVVEPILLALLVESEDAAVEYESLYAIQQEKEAVFEELRLAQDAAVDALKLKDPDAAPPEPSPEYIVADEELMDATDIAYSADLRSKSLRQKHDDLQTYVAVITTQADARQALVSVSEHLAYLSLGVQFWEDAAMVVDLELHPKGGDFVQGLLESWKEEVSER